MRFVTLFLLCLCWLLTFATPVKSVVGGRNVIYDYESNNPSGNPYITDGLIAMWDGEWNVGIGEHDSTTTVWIDLSGNGNDLEVNNVYCHWENNCLRSDIVRRNILFARSDKAFSYETCEFVMERMEFPGLVSFSGMGDYKMFEYDVSYVQFISPYTETVEGVVFPSKASCQCIYNGGSSVSAWINGLPMSRGTAMSNWTYATYKQNFGIGGGSSYQQYQMTGRIFAVRLYSRKLSEGELAHNLELDMARFIEK